MKPFVLIGLAAALALALPASAQNAGQIAQARRGASCPNCNLFQADLAGLEMRGQNFSGARLRQADLSASVMNRASIGSIFIRPIPTSASFSLSSDISSRALYRRP